MRPRNHRRLCSRSIHNSRHPILDPEEIVVDGVDVFRQVVGLRLDQELVEAGEVQGSRWLRLAGVEAEGLDKDVAGGCGDGVAGVVV